MPYPFALRSLLLGLALGLAAPLSQAALPDLPATYIGALPCADCAGIDWQLDLDADHSFALHQTYQGKGPGATLRRNGRWRFDEATQTLALETPGQAPITLAVAAADRLRLEQPGRSHDLSRLPQALPARASGTLTGLYSRQAGAPRLRLCAPGQPAFPVAAEDASRVLESAYGKLGHALGEALLVRLAGHLAARPGIAGSASQAEVVVERFYGIWPESSCSDATTPAQRAVAAPAPVVDTPAPLTGTTWRLVELDGEKVPLERGLNTPHLIFQDNGRLAGASGCNRLLGSYELKGQRISFGQVGGTLMACMHHLEQEQTFLRALSWVQSWQISGRYLLLRDGSGKAIGIFVAAPLQR